MSIFILIGSSSIKAAEKRNQLEELLIWKMSDELKLGSSEEKKFTDIVKSLNEKKAELNQALQASVEKMGSLTTTKSKEEELTRYRKVLQNYSRLNEEEYDRLKPLLGTEKMTQYLVIKQDLTNRIKNMLANPDSGTKNNKALPQPKV
ncbi:MAG: hypothetical protein AAGB31_01705, partial [Bdellovibrio sp.]